MHFSFAGFLYHNITVQTELQLPIAQTIALFVNIVRKISKQLTDIQKAAMGATIPEAATAPTIRVDGEWESRTTDWKPVEVSLDDELREASDNATNALREKQREMIDSLDSEQVSTLSPSVHHISFHGLVSASL